LIPGPRQFSFDTHFFHFHLEMGIETFAWKIGSISALCSILLGAFGSHALKQKLQSHPEGVRKLQNWHTAVQYQSIHSLALLAYSLKTGSIVPVGYGRYAPFAFVGGILMFSGSLYLLTLDVGNKNILGPITPLGGLCFIAGWGLLSML
jgi:uncharacterized membrane protein YgdD (TMEM256/DUF423 family)